MMTQSQRRHLLAGLASIAVASAAADVVWAASTRRELTPAEAELVQIRQEMDAAYRDYYAQRAAIEDETERARFAAENEPSAQFVARFIEFERTHHGTHVGLMAAREMVLLGMGSGPGGQRYAARLRALEVLEGYADAPILPQIILLLDRGVPEMRTEGLLRRLMDGPGVSEANRAFAKFVFGRWVLGMCDAHEYRERRLRELDEGDEPAYHGEKEWLLKTFSWTPLPERLSELKDEALAVLESLVDSGADIRVPAVIGINREPMAVVLEIDEQATKTKPSVRDFAAGMLFKHRHLRTGRPAPELELELVSGEKWSLAAQRGRVVVIQFSFRGCGPCEAMYPDLREMSQEYGDRLAILTIMADEKREDTMAAVESGKLTWNVYWDGRTGPVATQWSVTGFPTVYVVGPDGRMAADATARDEHLRSKIAELVR